MKDRIQYGYDRAGNRTWRKNLVAPENQDQHYLYDPLYQVTAAARGNLNLNQTAIGGIPAQRQTFDYDPTGNWDRYTTAEEGVQVLNQTRIHNQANQIVQIDGSNTGLLYDRAGNATQMPPNAAVDWSQHYKLTWDAWNRLVRVEDEEDTEVAAYAYDGTTRRTTKTVDGVTAHSYCNDRWKPVEERLGSATDPHLQYLWGARPGHRDELIRRDRDADDSGTLVEKLYCLMDYFDPISVTNDEGNIQERYQFSAFGLRSITDAEWTAQSESEFDFQHAFHGQSVDPETLYYNYGYRYYHSMVGRWLSKDPIGETGGVNVQAFVENHPVNDTDAYGLACCAASLKVRGDDFFYRPIRWFLGGIFQVGVIFDVELLSNGVSSDCRIRQYRTGVSRLGRSKSTFWNTPDLGEWWNGQSWTAGGGQLGYPVPDDNWKTSVRFYDGPGFRGLSEDQLPASHTGFAIGELTNPIDIKDTGLGGIGIVGGGDGGNRYATESEASEYFKMTTQIYDASTGDGISVQWGYYVRVKTKKDYSFGFTTF